MSTRVRFGSTDLEVSPVCFGTWQLSPRFWGDQPKDELLRAMRAAYEGGINFFDTADAYGDGLAETVLGEFLADVPRDEIVVCTKVFNHFNPDASRYPDLSPAHIRERCEIELRRLGVDTIDIYLLHMVDSLTPMADVTQTLDELLREGKIRHYGVSNHNVEQFRALRRLGRYEVQQPPYSFIAKEIEKDLLPYCESEDVGVMVYSPLHKGLLTGKYVGTEEFADFRQFHPDFQGERFQRIATAVQGVRTLAEGYGMSIYQLILGATLMHPGIQVAVVGIKTEAQIREACAAMGKTISRPDWHALRQQLNVAAPVKIKDGSGGTK
ncbi:MAG: aldo/keto reductase [Lentisphaeria bacterium]|nr:aldo/keto reductase [Lentisphaeria bacterium]